MSSADDLERRAQQLREEARDQRASERRSMFDPELTKSTQQKRNEQNAERSRRRRAEARKEAEQQISRLLADATDEQLRAALVDDDAFSRMTDSETIESLFGGRLAEFEDARANAREAIQRELDRREQRQPRADGGTVRANSTIAAITSIDDRILALALLGGLWAFSRKR